MQTSVRDIRFRLLALLFRAFITVLILSLIFFLGITGYILTFRPDFAAFRFPFVNSLEGYYLGHGSWDGVETLFANTASIPVENSILLDKDNRIILDRGLAPAATADSSYKIDSNDVAFPVTVNGEVVGTLVVTQMPASNQNQFARGVLIPVGWISFILALFLAVAALLLVRRFVNPLADVIFAARAVASGKLDTRIPTEGPQDLRSLSESFNEMATALERNDRERRDMLADVAHELRTPLSVIRGRLEGIVDGIYSENGPQVSMALEQTYVLQRLVDDLHLLTLAETRQLSFDKRDVQTGDVIERVIEMFSAEAQEKNISLSFSEKNGNLSAFVDPQRFEQVISNLVGNAIRYVPAGGKVWVTANEISDGVQITVNDNGEGIPTEDLPFIFDRFWRKDKSRARLSGGTGLGLAITKQLVEAQGGMIEARNLEEGGLQVVVGIKKN